MRRKARSRQRVNSDRDFSSVASQEYHRLEDARRSITARRAWVLGLGSFRPGSAAAAGVQEVARKDDARAVVRQFEREAEALRPLVSTPLARDFLSAVANLPAVTPRTLFRSADRRAFWSPDGAPRLGPEQRRSLEQVTLDEEFYYTTKYGTPLAYARPLEVLGRAGLASADGLKLLDFGYGTVGHLRLLASLGADVTGVDVDPLLRALTAPRKTRARYASGAGGRGG